MSLVQDSVNISNAILKQNMSEKKSTGEWDVLWQDYSNIWGKWQEVFDTFQKTTREMQNKYNEVMEKAASESSKDTMKEFGDNWQKAMSDAGINAFKQFETSWQKAMSEYTTTAFKEFGENWQKSMNDSGLEAMKNYGEMMNKFNDTWKKTWRS